MMAGQGFDEHEIEKDLEIWDLFRTQYKLTDFGSGELSAASLLLSNSNRPQRTWCHVNGLG